MKILYKNLYAEMSRYGYRVKDIAYYLEMTQQNLYSKIAGNTSFKENELFKIVDFFVEKEGVKFTIEYLFERSDRNGREKGDL